MIFAISLEKQGYWPGWSGRNWAIWGISNPSEIVFMKWELIVVRVIVFTLWNKRVWSLCCYQAVTNPVRSKILKKRRGFVH